MPPATRPPSPGPLDAVKVYPLNTLAEADYYDFYDYDDEPPEAADFLIFFKPQDFAGLFHSSAEGAYLAASFRPPKTQDTLAIQSLCPPGMEFDQLRFGSSTWNGKAHINELSAYTEQAFQYSAWAKAAESERRYYTPLLGLEGPRIMQAQKDNGEVFVNLRCTPCKPGSFRSPTGYWHDPQSCADTGGGSWQPVVTVSDPAKSKTYEHWRCDRRPSVVAPPWRVRGPVSLPDTWCPYHARWKLAEAASIEACGADPWNTAITHFRGTPGIAVKGYSIRTFNSDGKLGYSIWGGNIGQRITASCSSDNTSTCHVYNYRGLPVTLAKNIRANTWILGVVDTSFDTSCENCISVLIMAQIEITGATTFNVQGKRYRQHLGKCHGGPRGPKPGPPYPVNDGRSPCMGRSRGP